MKQSMGKLVAKGNSIRARKDSGTYWDGNISWRWGHLMTPSMDEWNLVKGQRKKAKAQRHKEHGLGSTGVCWGGGQGTETGAEGCDSRDFGCVPRPPLTGQWWLKNVGSGRIPRARKTTTLTVGGDDGKEGRSLRSINTGTEQSLVKQWAHFVWTHEESPLVVTALQGSDRTHTLSAKSEGCVSHRC